MTAKDAIRYALTTNAQIFKNYVSDLSDADLFIRPDPNANHIAWQIGHLIVAETSVFMPKVPGAQPPELPAGFTERHSKEHSKDESRDGFLTKQEYLALYDKVRSATVAALDGLTEADLEKPSGWHPMAPTVGALLMIVASHDMMHAGQFTVVRRKLGKPVLF